MKNNTGLTLLSLITTMALIIVLATIAVPSLANLLSKSETLSTTAIIHRSLSNARLLAIKHEETVTACGLDQTGSCISSNFEKFVIFYDLDRNGKLDKDEETFYLSRLQYGGHLNLKASFKSRFIRFNDSGMAEQAGSVIYCDPAFPQSAARVTVSMSGRSYLGRDEDGSGIVEDASGSDIRC